MLFNIDDGYGVKGSIPVSDILKVYDADGNEVAYAKSYSTTDDGNYVLYYLTYEFLLSKTITEEGEYTVKIPAGVVEFYDGDPESNDSAVEYKYVINAEEIVSTFRITGDYSGGDGNEDDGNDSTEITYYPENGATVASLEEVTLSCEAGITTAIGVIDATAVIKNAGGTVLAEYSDIEEIPNENGIITSVKIKFDEPVTADGTYYVVIDEGLFDIGPSGSNPSIFLHYTVDSTLSGINKVANGTEGNGNRYNLAGQRIPATAKGIQITADGKVIIK